MKSRSADDTDSNRQWGVGISAISWPICRRNHPFQPPRNNVGYTSKEAAQGKFLILGAGFQQSNGSTPVNGLVSGVTGVNYDEDNAFMSTAAQIQIPRASGGYTVLYYLNDAWYDDGSTEGATKAGWGDSNGVLVDAEFTPGIGFWFKSVSNDAFCTISGEVSSDSSSEISCPANFALRANPFPTAVSVNGPKFTSTDIVGVDYDEDGMFMTTAPQIQIPRASGGYTVLYYLNDGWYSDGSIEGATKAGWCDSNGVLIDAEIPVGQGIWTRGVTGAFTLEFVK